MSLRFACRPILREPGDQIAANHVLPVPQIPVRRPFRSLHLSSSRSGGCLSWKTRETMDVVGFAVFTMFFPTMMAGPIKRNAFRSTGARNRPGGAQGVRSKSLRDHYWLARLRPHAPGQWIARVTPCAARRFEPSDDERPAPCQFPHDRYRQRRATTRQRHGNEQIHPLTNRERPLPPRGTKI